MRLFFYVKWSLFFSLALILILCAAYKCAGLLSFYPNDWFLDEKIYRHHPQFFEEKKWGYRLICHQSNQKSFSKIHFSELFNQKIDHFRDHKHRSVFSVELSGKKMVVKCYPIKSFYHWIQKASIRSSSAYRAWHYGHELAKLGIATPQPLALFEKRWGPFWTTCYLVTEYLEGYPELATRFKEGINKENLHLLKELSSQLKILQKGRYIHSDYGFRNILVFENRPYLIDLDDLHQYRFQSPFFKKKSQSKHNEQLNRDLMPFHILKPHTEYDES